MNELFHIIEHTIGLCGEKHLNIIVMVTEWPNLNPIINYIKNLFK